MQKHNIIDILNFLLLSFVASLLSFHYFQTSLKNPAKSTPLQGVMSSTGLSGEVLHSITLAAGKTQWLLRGLQQSCARPAQINNALKMTNTSERQWEETTDQRVFVH
jgi:hypothetical protein